MSSPGLERNPESGLYVSRSRRVNLSDEDLVALVNSYIQQFRHKTGKPNYAAVKAKLGWNHTQWAAFKKKCGALLVVDHIPKFSVIETPEVVDPNGVKRGLAERGIETDEVARRIEAHFGELRQDLYSIGLTREEVNASLAMQNFGENRFMNAMQMIGSGVFKTHTKLQTQQAEVEARIAEVRTILKEYGNVPSEERTGWVEEESMLTKQYVAIGKLLSDIQETWYQGSAQLALVQMRMREDPNAPRGVTQRSNRPGFTPRIINAEPLKNEPANPPPPEQAPVPQQMPGP